MKKIVILISSIIILGFVIISDIVDRTVVFSHQPKFGTEDLTFLSDEELDIEKYYTSFFNNPKYKFPRKKTASIKLYENRFLLSRLTSKTANSQTKNLLIKFFNNPTNFNWSETTWSLRESEYILRFFDEDDSEIGKVFLCLKGCGMTESLPFSPNMKFGGLSEIGEKKLNVLLKQIKSE